jgi:hypothetical protein
VALLLFCSWTAKKLAGQSPSRTRLIARRVIHRSYTEPFQALQLIFATRNPRCKDYMIGHTLLASCMDADWLH